MIFLDLNFTSSLFWFLISFWKLLWYCLLFEVKANQTSKKLLIISHHIKCKMIQGELLVIFILQSKLWGWVIDIDFILILMRWNKKCTSCVIHHWNTMIILYLSCFTLKYNVSLFSQQTSNQWFIRIFYHNFTKQSKNYINFDSQ